MYGRSEDEWDDLIVSGYDQLKQVARHGTFYGTICMINQEYGRASVA